jgi:signal peptidase
MAKKILSIVLNVVLTLILFVGFVILFSLLPIKNNIKILSVMSGSMEPTIKTGSLILIKPVDVYQVNDVITFVTPSGKDKKDYTTHRLDKINQSGQAEIYTTKGDANNATDGWLVYKKDIIGKCYFVIPFVGYLVGYAKTLPGLILLIVIPATIIIYEEFRKLSKEVSELKKRKKTVLLEKNERKNEGSQTKKN